MTTCRSRHRVYLTNGSVALSVVTVGIHALGPAAVKGQRDGRDHGLGVQVQSAGLPRRWRAYGTIRRDLDREMFPG